MEVKKIAGHDLVPGKTVKDHIHVNGTELHVPHIMLWGGAILLCYEHVWHGEVVPWFPFLTAMADPGDAAEMFHEMATVGVTMAVIITVTWFIMCKVSDAIMARKTDAVGQEA